jgi:hypothetical protein
MLEVHSIEAEDFLSQLNQLAALLQSVGYKVLPYRDDSLPLYNALSQHQQKEVMKNLKAYCLALSDGLLDEEEFNTTRLAWRFLVAVGYFPSEELFDTLREELYVQIYNFDQFQIFRSLSFFEHCSLSLEEIVCRPWWQVWKRSRQDLHILSEVSRQSLVSPVCRTIRFELPYERAEELCGTQAHNFSYRIKSATALTRSGRQHATLLVEDWLI